MSAEAELSSNEVYCSSCGESINQKAEFCPHCGVSNQTGDEKDSKIGKTGYIAIGVVSALIALGFVPIVFGALSVFSGWKVYSNWNEWWGIGIMALGGVCGLLGIVIGMYAGMGMFA